MEPRFFCGLLLGILLFVGRAAAAPEVIPLWANGAPGFENRRDEPEQAKDYWVKNIHNPSLTVFLPPAEKNTGAAVLVIPGGGHRELVYQAEGTEPAEYLNKLGVAAFVLKHRLAREEGSPYSLDVHPRQDAQRAMRIIRSRAAEWNIDPARIGMLGFSAGGEVVADATFRPATPQDVATDAIDQVDARPNFVMIIYPGPLGIPAKIPADAPPAFLLVSDDDWSHATCVTDLLTRYREAGVPVEAHVFTRGGHGYNMGFRSDLATIKHWPERMTDWMADNFVLDPAGREEYLAQRIKQRADYENQSLRRRQRQ
ncbi:MAG: alpha/beta hydrolase [Bythopirellula sp.]|nr:alpha/beta hydrolase [Bythopirellula sp.]